MPFGGVQMVFIGDMFQLSPIMMDKEQHIINQRYPEGPWFFNSHAYKRLDKEPLFLTKYIGSEILFSKELLRALEKIKSAISYWHTLIKE